MLLPPHLLPAVFLGLETGTEVEVGTPASPAEGLSPRCQQEGVPVQGAAVWTGGVFSELPLCLTLGSITLGSDTCFPPAPKLSCLHFLNGKR